MSLQEAKELKSESSAANRVKTMIRISEGLALKKYFIYSPVSEVHPSKGEEEKRISVVTRVLPLRSQKKQE